MEYNRNFFKQAELMIECLSSFKDDGIFALKGGTAINFFHHKMPRLSVDIDLTYIKVNSREDAFREMKEGLDSYRNNLEKRGLHTEYRGAGEGNTKLFVFGKEANIKIEPNYVLRGTLYPTQIFQMVDEARELFSLSSNIRTLDYRELFAGKMMAFLDRQNPRDIFDMGEFLNYGHHIDEIIDAVAVYIAQHNGMISHILNPNLQDKEAKYNEQFSGMTIKPVEYKQLLKVREIILEEFHRSLKNEHGKFLISLMEKSPKWGILPFQGIEQLPGILWKIQNIKNMPEKSRLKEINELREFFKL